MPESLKFQLDLIDKLTKPGKEMAAQMQKLKLQLKHAEQAMRQTEQALGKLQKGKIVDIDTYRKLTKQLDAQKSAVAGYRSSILGLAPALEEQKSAQKTGAEAMEDAATKGTILGHVYVKLGEYALKAAAAIAQFAMSGFSLAISATDAKGDVLEALDAFMATSEEVDYVYNSLVDMGDRVAISMGRGRELATELSAAGVTNAGLLIDAIESIGKIESVLGAGVGGKIQNIIERSQASGQFKLDPRQLMGTGVSNDMIAQALGLTPKQMEAQMKAGQISAEKGIAALTKAVDQKFSGIASKQLLDLPVQMQKAKDNISKLFEDVKVEGFLAALQDVLSVLDQNTAAGAALKEIVGSMFDGLFKAVEFVMPFVKTFFKGMIIIALQLYIAFKPLIKTIKDAFGGDNQSSVDGFAGALSKVGEILGAVVTAAMPAIIGLFHLLKSIIGAYMEYVGVMWSIYTTIADVMIQVFGFFANIAGKFYEIGASIVTGLVDGIKSMVNAPIDTLKNMANGALGAFKSVFGIASPSKVMGEMGGHLMGGLEQGIDQSSGAPQAAMSEAVAPPIATSGGAGGAGGGGGITVTVAPGAIVISGVSGAQQVAEMLPEMLANVMEQLMLESGAKAA